MTDKLLKDRVLGCYDNGLFMELCLKLADSYKEVIYYTPWKNAYPRMNEAMIGTEWVNGKRLDTFDGKPFRRVENFFDHINEMDEIFFPDVYDGDMQVFLDSLGKPIFGGRKGEELELERWDTKEYFRKRGMDVQPIKRVVGLDALRGALKGTKNKWIKISKYRKSFETFHHIDYELTEPILDKIAWDLGPMAKICEFIIEDDIDAIVEEGVDMYTIDGQYPNYLFCGTEIKDKSFAGKFIPYSELSKGCKEVNKQMAPILKAYGYRGLFSTEVRTTTDGKHYFIDPCTRGGSPPNELYQEIYKNLGDIVHNGANGKLIDPIPAKKYGLEAIIWSDWFMGGHQSIKFPPEIRQWVKLRNAIKIDGAYHILNLHNMPEAAALVAIGDSFEECKSKMEEMAPMIQGKGIEVKIDALDESIEEFNKMIK